jgi:hypothetical protein
MVVKDHQFQNFRRDQKTTIELDDWLAAAKEVLAANEGPHGETHGGKRVRMRYSYLNYWNNEEAMPLERIENFEVD